MNREKVKKYLQAQNWVLSDRHGTVPHWYFEGADEKFKAVVDFIFTVGDKGLFFRKSIMSINDGEWQYFVDFTIEKITKIKRKKI